MVNNYVSQRAFARQVGLSHTRIQQLVAEGKLKTNEKGQVLLDERVNFLKNEQQLKEKEQKIKEYIESSNGQDGLNEALLKMTEEDPLTAQNILKAKELYYKTIAKKIEVDKLNGDVIEINTAKNIFKSLALKCREELLSIPQRLAVRCENRTAREIEDLIEDAINGALEHLQEGNIK